MIRTTVAQEGDVDVVCNRYQPQGVATETTNKSITSNHSWKTTINGYNSVEKHNSSEILCMQKIDSILSTKGSTCILGVSLNILS